MRLDLLRTQRQGPTGTADGTFGAFTLHDGPQDGIVFQCCSLEDDWEDNAQGTSCIPAGSYTLVRHTMIHGIPGLHTWMFQNVPNRSGICIHYARTEEQVEGCVAIGPAFQIRDVAKDEDTLALNVKKQGLAVGGEATFADFMKVTAGVESFPCTVRWAPGLP